MQEGSGSQSSKEQVKRVNPKVHKVIQKKAK